MLFWVFSAHPAHLRASAVKKQPAVAKSLYPPFNSANVFLKYLPLIPPVNRSIRMSGIIRIGFVSLFCLFMCAAALPQSQPPVKKKRVAVLDFEYGTVSSSVAAIFGTNQDVGKGIADLLVQKLVQDGKFSVIERKALDKIIAEQNFNNSDRADPTSAAKIGKIRGVDARGAQLDAASANVPTHKAEVSGLVADVSGGTLIINVGSRSGLRVGDMLEISRAIRTVKDPASGKVIKTVTSKIGDATVTEVDTDSATVSFTGTGPAKVGDVAKSPQAQQTTEKKTR